LTIAYDANGNRTGVTLNGTPSTYTTETTSNRLSSTTSPARSFGYDSAGNTTSDTGGYTATYDASGRLATLTKAGTTTTYSYNGLGQRVRKFSSSGAGSTTLFVYDQNGQLLGEYDQSGSAVREYVWFGSTPIAVLLPNGGNDPLAYYFHTDHLNTPRLVTDTANNIRWRWLAEPFGTTAPEDNPSSLGAFTQNLRFPGQYADQESGLSYNYFRNYDASIGRYNTSDPIGLEGGVNTFAYVKGNTLSYSDPQGLNAVAVLPGVGALCAASAGTGCAAAAVGAVGVGAYWLTDTYVNPWAQPLITKAIDACTVDWDQIQKDTDHANYHRTCDRKPPSNLTPCELARWNRRQAQSCFDKRSEWEERWGDSSTKAAHRRALENVKRRLSNAVQDIITFCPASL
jgi:RHS repeat-associated protein